MLLGLIYAVNVGNEQEFVAACAWFYAVALNPGKEVQLLSLSDDLELNFYQRLVADRALAEKRS